MWPCRAFLSGWIIIHTGRFVCLCFTENNNQVCSISTFNNSQYFNNDTNSNVDSLGQEPLKKYEKTISDPISYMEQCTNQTGAGIVFKRKGKKEKDNFHTRFYGKTIQFNVEEFNSDSLSKETLKKYERIIFDPINCMEECSNQSGVSIAYNRKGEQMKDILNTRFYKGTIQFKLEEFHVGSLGHESLRIYDTIISDSLFYSKEGTNQTGISIALIRRGFYEGTNELELEEFNDSYVGQKTLKKYERTISVPISSMKEGINQTRVAIPDDGNVKKKKETFNTRFYRELGDRPNCSQNLAQVIQSETPNGETKRNNLPTKSGSSLSKDLVNLHQLKSILEKYYLSLISDNFLADLDEVEKILNLSFWSNLISAVTLKYGEKYKHLFALLRRRTESMKRVASDSSTHQMILSQSDCLQGQIRNMEYDWLNSERTIMQYKLLNDQPTLENYDLIPYQTSIMDLNSLGQYQGDVCYEQQTMLIKSRKSKMQLQWIEDKYSHLKCILLDDQLSSEFVLEQRTRDVSQIEYQLDLSLEILNFLETKKFEFSCDCSQCDANEQNFVESVFSYLNMTVAHFPQNNLEIYKRTIYGQISCMEELANQIGAPGAYKRKRKQEKDILNTRFYKETIKFQMEEFNVGSLGQKTLKKYDTTISDPIPCIKEGTNQTGVSIAYDIKGNMEKDNFKTRFYEKTKKFESEDFEVGFLDQEVLKKYERAISDPISCMGEGINQIGVAIPNGTFDTRSYNEKRDRKNSSHHFAQVIQSETPNGETKRNNLPAKSGSSLSKDLVNLHQLKSILEKYYLSLISDNFLADLDEVEKILNLSFWSNLISAVTLNYGEKYKHIFALLRRSTESMEKGASDCSTHQMILSQSDCLQGQIRNMEYDWLNSERIIMQYKLFHDEEIPKTHDLLFNQTSIMLPNSQNSHFEYILLDDQLSSESVLEQRTRDASHIEYQLDLSLEILNFLETEKFVFSCDCFQCDASVQGFVKSLFSYLNMTVANFSEFSMIDNVTDKFSQC